MAGILLNKWFQIGATGGLAVVVGVVIGVIVTGVRSEDSAKGAEGAVATGDVSDETAVVGNVQFRNGGYSPTRYRDGSGVPLRADKPVELPLTVAEAVAAGWKDPVLCSPSRGRYFQKSPAGEGEPYFLMYNYLDRLIGIYHFSELETPSPWVKEDSIRGGGGLTIIDFEHWGLFVYFQDPTQACKTTEEQEGGGAPISGGLNTQVKSTPTPVVPPRPTPTAGEVLETVVARTAKVSSLSFTLTGDPVARKVEGTLDRKGTLTLVREGVVTVTDSAGTTQDLDAGSLPFSFESLGATLSVIAGALQEPVDAKGAFIDNLKRRGVSGTVLGSDLSALFPTAVADARVAVSLWFDERGRVRRLRIEGAVTPGDPPDTVRVLDMGGL